MSRGVDGYLRRLGSECYRKKSPKSPNVRIRSSDPTTKLQENIEKFLCTAISSHTFIPMVSTTSTSTLHRVPLCKSYPCPLSLHMDYFVLFIWHSLVLLPQVHQIHLVTSGPRVRSRDDLPHASWRVDVHLPQKPDMLHTRALDWLIKKFDSIDCRTLSHPPAVMIQP